MSIYQRLKRGFTIKSLLRSSSDQSKSPWRRATALAEAGATPHEFMARFGWKSIKEAEIYTRAASQKKLDASAERLVPGANG